MSEATVGSKISQLIAAKREAKKAVKMGSLSKEQGFDNLGNHIYLEKQDKLRDIGVNIQTSQVRLTSVIVTKSAVLILLKLARLLSSDPSHLARVRSLKT